MASVVCSVLSSTLKQLEAQAVRCNLSDDYMIVIETEKDGRTQLMAADALGFFARMKYRNEKAYAISKARHSIFIKDITLVFNKSIESTLNITAHVSGDMKDLQAYVGNFHRTQNECANTGLWYTFINNRMGMVVRDTIAHLPPELLTRGVHNVSNHQLSYIVSEALKQLGLQTDEVSLAIRVNSAA